MKKREAQVERDARDAREYNENLRKEYEERDAAGEKKRGKQKEPKEIPVWDDASALLDIIEQDVFNGRKYLNDFVEIKLTNANGVYQVEAFVDQTGKEAYIKKYYGKKLICTDHVEWSTLQILESYRDEECVEGLFCASKDTDHFAIRPQYH